MDALRLRVPSVTFHRSCVESFYTSCDRMNLKTIDKRSLCCVDKADLSLFLVCQYIRNIA